MTFARSHRRLQCLRYFPIDTCHGHLWHTPVMVSLLHTATSRYAMWPILDDYSSAFGLPSGATKEKEILPCSLVILWLNYSYNNGPLENLHSFLQSQISYKKSWLIFSAFESGVRVTVDASITQAAIVPRYMEVLPAAFLRYVLPYVLFLNHVG